MGQLDDEIAYFSGFDKGSIDEGVGLLIIADRFIEVSWAWHEGNLDIIVNE